MIGTARIIENDLFSVADRLKSIDDSYFIVYSYKNRRFEVHSRSQRGDTFALAVPYPELDERTVRLVRKTRAERIEKFIAEMERENAELEKREISRAVKKTEKEIERAYGKL